MTPAVSIIIPTYNGEKYLPDALRSLVEQEPFGETMEVLAIDNGSTDGTLRILEEAKGALPLQILDGGHTGNWVLSTNTAMKKAKGEWIAFLHHDDRYRPPRLRRMFEEIRRHPKASFFLNTTGFIGSDGTSLGTWRPSLRPGFNPPEECIPSLLVQNTFAVPGAFFRRALVEGKDGLDPALRYTADWDFWLRLAVHEGVFFVPDTLSEFRVHGGSQTVGFAEHQLEMKGNLNTVVDRFLPALDNLIPSGRLRSRYRRLARLGIETNLFLGAAGSGVRPPWGDFLSALFHCSPFDWIRYVRTSAVLARSRARIRAGFLRR